MCGSLTWRSLAPRTRCCLRGLHRCRQELWRAVPGTVAIKADDLRVLTAMPSMAMVNGRALFSEPPFEFLQGVMSAAASREVPAAADGRSRWGFGRCLRERVLPPARGRLCSGVRPPWQLPHGGIDARREVHQTSHLMIRHQPERHVEHLYQRAAPTDLLTESESL
jgi:hypothetical protein